jgi:type I restriction enzyme S subunit
MDAWGDMRIPVPPPDEQQGIAEAIAVVCARIDDLIGESTGAMALLQERRAALISAAVTGKIDVRDLAS